MPQRSEELRNRLRASAEAHGPGYLHRLLARLDPETAGKIAAADEQKLIRAIEVCVLARRPLSEVHRTGRTPLVGWRALKIGLMPPREALYERIHARTDAMLAAGWMEEVRELDGERIYQKMPSPSISSDTANCARSCVEKKNSRKRARRFSKPRGNMQNASLPGSAKIPAFTGSRVLVTIAHTRASA